MFNVCILAHCRQPLLLICDVLFKLIFLQSHGFVCICYLLMYFEHTACQPLSFKNTLSNDDMCQPCPMFSNTTDIAVAVCPCDPGYFRPLDGSEDAMPCTRK